MAPSLEVSLARFRLANGEPQPAQLERNVLKGKRIKRRKDSHVVFVLMSGRLLMKTKERKAAPFPESTLPQRKRTFQVVLHSQERI